MEQGVQPVVQFTDEVLNVMYHQKEFPPHPGMKARILSIEAYSEDYDMEVHCSFREFEKENEPFIPQDSVLRKNNQSWVWVISLPKEDVAKCPFVILDNPWIEKYMEEKTDIPYVAWLEQQLANK